MEFDKVLCLRKKGRLPMLNGLLKADHSYYAFSGRSLSPKTDPPALDTLYCSAIDCLGQLKETEFAVFWGEGSYGSEGWILFLSNDKEKSWLLSGNINPIEKVYVSEDVIFAENNNHKQFMLPIYSPENYQFSGP